ncbi:MAG: iron-sulfur cluster-binding protein [Candidatus Lambdaproteobacteria bacterium]|nr:iron-sulfur cluster-binding protein [Candidatus Lambdaproteobacteria bacterium]
MKADPRQFRQDSARAIGDPTLRANLRHTLGRIRARRAEALAAIEDVEALRRIGNAIKQESLRRLPRLLEQLEANLVRNGVRVHWAETLAEANGIVLAIARANGVRLAVKGKSMVSEEMELNAFLAEHGIEAIEADLGEYIVQLAGQPPSHIVAPAMHMNRHQVAALFHDKLGAPDVPDIEAMTALARRILREKFQRAGMGITGVNFAIAETGTLCLVENEGNGRMVTTVPPVHVALMGIEKVIARLADLPPLMRLLTRSATGQPISTYFNWISGPRRPGEKDGPREVHLVILDNGRSAIYADAQLRETLDCVRCGACLNICPVFERIGGHAYGSMYMGPIGKLLTPQMAGLGQAGHLVGASTLCGACFEVCPVQIPIPALLLRLRQEASQPSPAGRALVRGAGGARNPAEAMVWKGWQVLHDSAAAYRVFARLAALAGDRLPAFGPLKAWARHRALPRPAPRSLHRLLRDRPGE